MDVKCALVKVNVTASGEDIHYWKMLPKLPYLVPEVTLGLVTSEANNTGEMLVFYLDLLN